MPHTYMIENVLQPFMLHVYQALQHVKGGDGSPAAGTHNKAATKAHAQASRHHHAC